MTHLPTGEPTIMAQEGPHTNTDPLKGQMVSGFSYISTSVAEVF